MPGAPARHDRSLLSISGPSPTHSDVSRFATIRPVPISYTLEVTSPGLERPLRTPTHFRGALGATVSVRTHPNVEGDRRAHGTLVAADDNTIIVRLDEGDQERILRYGDIERARTVFVWGPAETNQKPAATPFGAAPTTTRRQRHEDRYGGRAQARRGAQHEPSTTSAGSGDYALRRLQRMPGAADEAEVEISNRIRPRSSSSPTTSTRTQLDQPSRATPKTWPYRGADVPAISDATHSRVERSGNTRNTRS